LTKKVWAILGDFGQLFHKLIGSPW
jgi:hypothetical protein